MATIRSANWLSASRPAQLCAHVFVACLALPGLLALPSDIACLPRFCLLTHPQCPDAHPATRRPACRHGCLPALLQPSLLWPAQVQRGLTWPRLADLRAGGGSSWRALSRLACRESSSGARWRVSLFDIGPRLPHVGRRRRPLEHHALSVRQAVGRRTGVVWPVGVAGLSQDHAGSPRQALGAMTRGGRGQGHTGCPRHAMGGALTAVNPLVPGHHGC